MPIIITMFGKYPVLDINNDISSIDKISFIGSPIFAIFNGSAAVTIFFVLSGYVLSLKWSKPNALIIIIDTLIKRYFRLLPLVLLSVLISAILFYSNFYYFKDAANISNSVWLSNPFWGLEQNAKPAIKDIFSVGFLTFFTGNSSLNTPLWTMKYELYGSILVLSLSMLLIINKKFRNFALFLLFIIAAIFYKNILEYTRNYIFYIMPFLLGFTFTLFNLKELKINRYITVIMTLFAIYLIGFMFPIGSYSWIAKIDFLSLPKLRLIGNVTAASLLLIIFASNNFISHSFTGKISQFLGFMSFPLYLVHIPIMCSFSALIYIYFAGTNFAVIMAGLTLMIISFPFIIILGKLDASWLKILSKWQPSSFFLKNTIQKKG